LSRAPVVQHQTEVFRGDSGVVTGHTNPVGERAKGAQIGAFGEEFLHCGGEMLRAALVHDHETPHALALERRGGVRRGRNDRGLSRTCEPGIGGEKQGLAGRGETRQKAGEDEYGTHEDHSSGYMRRGRGEDLASPPHPLSGPERGRTIGGRSGGNRLGAIGVIAAGGAWNGSGNDAATTTMIRIETCARTLACSACGASRWRSSAASTSWCSARLARGRPC